MSSVTRQLKRRRARNRAMIKNTSWKMPKDFGWFMIRLLVFGGLAIAYILAMFVFFGWMLGIVAY